MSVFNDYSNYYDLLYEDKDYAAEVEYIHTLIQQEFPGAKTILNLGCGTGRHDALLAQKGYDIMAIDLSETMISIAKKNYSETNAISFAVDDIRTFKSDRKFDVVLSLFHVMSYQVENTDLRNAFETAKHHLNPGGVFMFDCWYGPGVLTDRPQHKLKTAENDSLKIIRVTTPVSHEEANCVDVIFDISILNKTEGINHQFTETHKMRYLFVPEIRLFAELTNLRLENYYKWMTFESPSRGDWYTINILK